MSTSPSTSERALSYLGVAAKSAWKGVTLENAVQLGLLIGISSVEFGSAGTAGLALLPLVLANTKMAHALVSKVGDLATQLPSVFGDTRSAAVITNVVSAGLVSAAATTLSHKDPIASTIPGAAVLAGAGTAFMLKKVWENCCATRFAARPATGPAAN